MVKSRNLLYAALSSPGLATAGGGADAPQAEPRASLSLGSEVARFRASSEVGMGISNLGFWPCGFEGVGVSRLQCVAPGLPCFLHASAGSTQSLSTPEPQVQSLMDFSTVRLDRSGIES